MEKELVKIEIGNGKIINLFVKQGADKNVVINEVKKGAGKALAYFDCVEKIEFAINFIYSREEFDQRVGQKTENWVIARSFGDKFIIFSPDDIEKCTSHKKNEFSQIICHETCHVLLEKINPKFSFWMFEGIALNVANQEKKGNIREESTKYFIDECLFVNSSYEKFISNQGYLISYLMVKFLINNYSKKMLMDLLKIKYDSKNSFAKELCKIMNKEESEMIELVKNILINKTD